MAQVYKYDPDRDLWVQITTLEGTKPSEDTVKLMIKDDWDTETTIYNGKSYIFGQQEKVDRWVPINGIKCWYPADPQSLFQDGGIYLNSEFLKQGIEDCLYKEITLKPSDFQHTENCLIKGFYNTEYINGKRYLTIEVTRQLDYESYTTTSLRKHAFLLENDTENDTENITKTYCGFLPVVFEIETTYKATIQLLFVALKVKGNDVTEITDHKIMTNQWESITNSTDYWGRQNADPIKLNTKISELEYYNTIGVTEVYEKATIDEVQAALGNNSSNSQQE